MGRIFITGDCHGKFNFLEDFCRKNETTRDDILIILGDAGINYYLNKTDRKLKQYISSLPITLLCVHGNHEARPSTLPGYSLIKMWGTWCWFEEEFSNIFFPMDGPITINGYDCLILGGAYSVDKYYRLMNNWTWFKDEQMSEEVKKHIMYYINNTNNSFDYIFSHTAPLNYEPRYLFLSTVDQSTVDKSMEEFLQEVYDKIDFKMWYFGHYHDDNMLASNLRIVYNDIIEL